MSAGTQGRRPNAIARAATAFGRFWWDFLIGDTPELFVATLVVIGLAVVLHHHGIVAVVAVPLAVIGFLGLSTWRGREQTK
jgi:hypothetical protein